MSDEGTLIHPYDLDGTQKFVYSEYLGWSPQQRSQGIVRFSENLNLHVGLLNILLFSLELNIHMHFDILLE